MRRGRRRAAGAIGAVVLLLCAALRGEPTTRDVLWISAPRRAAFEPAAAFDDAGRLWAVWVSTSLGMHNTRAAGRIDGACLDDGEVVASFTFEDGGPLPALPQLVRDTKGVYCVWEAGVGGARRLEGRALHFDDGVRPGPLEALPTGSATPLAPSLAATRGGQALVFQGLAGGDYDLFHMQRSEGRWSTAKALTETDRDCWNPRLAVDSADVQHVVWDVFDGRSFDVVYARVRDGELTGRIDLATGPGFDGYPEVAVEPDGTAWVAWERAASFGELGGLRGDREAGLARIEGGEVAWVAPKQLSRRNARRELPRPFATASGLILASRQPVRGDRKRDHLFTSWTSVLARFDAQPADEEDVLETDGGADHELVLLARPDATWLVFAADGRGRHYGEVTGWSSPTERLPRVGVARSAPPAGFPEVRDAPLPELRRVPPPPLAPPPGTGGASGGVLWGDLHRHTAFSRCGGAKDGSLLDTWRYARGPGRLDFVAVTDHYQHLQPWSFWRTIRDTERYHAPGSLVTFAGIERVRAARGHYNDIYLDPAHVRWDPEVWGRAPAGFAPAPPDEVISIPHMMSVDDGTGFDWDEFDEDRTRLFEVYQGKRGSYEGAGLPFEAIDGVEPATALARGFERGAHFGLVAASDHVSSGTSYAGVVDATRTRESVFAALRARHALGATSQRPVRASLGPLAMGDAGSAPPGARFEVTVAPSEEAGLAYVELVADGETTQRFSAPPGDVELWVLTLRRGYALGRSGFELRVDGGRLRDARVRRSATATIERKDDASVVFVRNDYVQADLALTVQWLPGAEHAFSVPADAGRRRVSRTEVATGRALALSGKGHAGSLWRLGTPLQGDAGPISFEVDASAEHSYYARVAWRDGNLAWTSPVRVRSEAEEGGR